MFRLGVRRFTTTAARAVESAAQMESKNAYGLRVSAAQGTVKGLVGGKPRFCRQQIVKLTLFYSDRQHSSHSS